MATTIVATHLELTPAIRDYIEKRMAGIRKVTPGDPAIAVEIEKTTHHHRHGEFFAAKVNITTVLGKKYHAASEKSDLYEAIDDVRNEIVRELSSAKDKKDALWRRGARHVKNILKGFR